MMSGGLARGASRTIKQKGRREGTGKSVESLCASKVASFLTAVVPSFHTDEGRENAHKSISLPNNKANCVLVVRHAFLQKAPAVC